MASFREIAPYLTHPLSLIGFALFLVSGIHRTLIKSKLLRPLTQDMSSSTVRLLLLFEFIIAVLLILAGFGLEFFKEAHAPKLSIVNPSGSTQNPPLTQAQPSIHQDAGSANTAGNQSPAISGSNNTVIYSGTDAAKKLPQRDSKP